MMHEITLGNGPVEAGYYPYAICTCGCYIVSKDADLVAEYVEQHVKGNQNA